MGVPVQQDGFWRVGGVTVFPEAGFTRPADTTQYTAADVVSASTATTQLMRFKNCVRVEGGSGILYGGILFDSVDAATNPNFSLVLFDNTQITLAVDNAAGTVTDDEARSSVAAITFDGTVAANVHTVGGNLIITATAVGQAFKCAEGSRDLYGLVIDRGGYTPASGEQFRFRLCILQD